MRQINLLPNELRTTGKILNLSNNLRTLLVVALIAVVVGAGGSVYYITRIKSELDRDLNKQKALEAQIQNLEAAEQRLVLVKDRVARAKEIAASDDTSAEAASFRDIYPRAVDNQLVISDLELSLKDLKVTLDGQNSTGIAQFIDGILSQNLFSGMQLENLDFNETSGYSLSLKLDSKETK